jgi:hypothetical protein
MTEDGVEAVFDFEMGPPESGVQCGSAHIGGAKSIRLSSDVSRGGRRPPFVSSGIEPRSQP